MSLWSSIPSKELVDSKNAKENHSSSNFHQQLKHPRVGLLKRQISKPGPVQQEFGSDDEDVSGRSSVALIGDVHIDISSTDRKQWSNPVEFLLSCVSMSVGLGNVWRFPTTAYENGGGAFLIPYLIVLTFIGRPLYFMELALGQFSSFGGVKTWKIVPAFKGVGFGQSFGTWAIVTYYVSLMAITVFYFVQSFSSVLPWTICDPVWSNDLCVDSSGNSSFNKIPNAQSSSEQYFYKYVLNHYDSIDDGIGLPDWRLALCLLFSWVILFLTLYRGVQSSGKVAYFTALFPYVVLITLLVRGLTLPGSFTGIMYFITPKWEKLLEAKVWYNAVVQSFFSMGVGQGALQMFSSFNDFKHPIYRDAWIISLADTFTSLLAGCTIFGILGYLAHELNTDIESVVRSGSGLAFISYPDIIAKFDFAPQVFAVLFFLMLFTLGVGSAAGMTGGVITVICDQFPILKKQYVTLAICIIGFLIGLVYITPGGQWILELVDFFGGGFVIFTLVIIETIAINWIYGMPNLVRDINFMLDMNLGIYWKFCWAFFIPVSLSSILIYSMVELSLPTVGGVSFPYIAYVCGWMLPAIALSFIPIGFIHAVYCSHGSTVIESVRSTFRAKPTWRPKKDTYYKEWLLMKKEL
ncbi:unnamed protein product, partial [Meganyctiphanes norvegica]